MIIKMINRNGLETGRYIFPEDIFDVDGYSRECMEDCGALEAYAEERLKEFGAQEAESIELQVNSGVTFALAAVLNVFNRMEKDISVAYYDKKTEGYAAQKLPWKQTAAPGHKNTVAFQLVKNRHRHAVLQGLGCIYGREEEENGRLEEGLLFDFDELEAMAEQKLRAAEAGTVVLYATGMSQCLVSVVKVCRKLGKRLVIMHFNMDTDDYFSQELL